MSEELKTCPFCPTSEYLGPGSIIAVGTCQSGKYIAMECGKCGARGPEVRSLYGGEQRARDAWNTRAGEQS